jgi:biopolymer transport protein ExbD
MRFRRKLQLRTTLDLVPLIDVVFQLIIYFMVATTFILTPGISLLLPRSTTSEPVAMTRLVVTILSRDEIYLNKERYDLRGLDGRLRAISKVEKEKVKTIIIEGDSDVPYSLMVDVLDILRNNGFKGVNLRTRQVKEGAP